MVMMALQYSHAIWSSKRLQIGMLCSFIRKLTGYQLLQSHNVSRAANRRRKRNIDDIHDCNNVLKDLEDWCIQKKKDLANDLRYLFTRASTGQMASPPPPITTTNQRASPLTVTGSNLGNRVSNLPADNPVNRQLNEQARDETEDPASEQRRDLSSRWRYTDTHCKLDAPYCWVTADGNHISLDNKDFKNWSC